MRPGRALLGVHDKRGVVELAAGLLRHGVELVATGGTERELRAAGIPVTPVSELTGVGEMLDGRVKTLHPAIHAGILARRDLPAHLQQLDAAGYPPFDMVVVNLYPFAEAAAAGLPLSEVAEQIDIGGPTLLRAAAKNWRWVAAVSAVHQYRPLLEALERGGLDEELLLSLAAEAFALTASYDAQIAAHLRRESGAGAWPERLTLALTKVHELRYGENPHQTGALYAPPAAPGVAGSRQLQGPELSYTNWLDADSAWRLVSALPRPAAVVVKHTNPCGAALGTGAAGVGGAADAFQRAYDCDPRSAYGGVVALNCPLDLAAADAIRAHFLELVLAPEVTPEAREWLASKGRLRVLEAPLAARSWELRSISGGVLAQEPDLGPDPEEQMAVVSVRAPSPEEWRQLRLAWQVVAQVKSNAIVLCRGGMAVGIGAGQMSRVEAVELAVARAGERARGSCLASDAFFPMADNLEVAGAAGITAAIHPGGSKRDREVIDTADRLGMALVTTGRRHFRH